MNSNSLPTIEKPLRLGTRKSPLAMTQTEMAASAIRSAHRLEHGAVVIVPMLAGGDRIQDRPLAEIGGKALWTKELERALIDGEIDAGVHSMKDVETVRPDNFTIAACLPRADVRDKLVGADSIADLPKGAKVGTSSPRRAAQLLSLRPDLTIVSLRGNVATRLARIESGDADATLLAAAGLDRLSMPDTGVAMEIEDMLPAASQGAIGIDCLSENLGLRELLEAVNHYPTQHAVNAERAFLEAVGGDCHSPVAANAVFEGERLILRAEILMEDGSERRSGSCDIAGGHHSRIQRLAAQLLEEASADLRAVFGR